MAGEKFGKGKEPIACGNLPQANGEREKPTRDHADWFLMENVPAAPEPVVQEYGVTAFLLDNSARRNE